MINGNDMPGYRSPCGYSRNRASSRAAAVG
jgi:hypothetical protein